MRDLDNIQTQLAQEQAALSATQDQILAAHRRMAEAQQQIAAIEEQVQAATREVEELQARSRSIQKRMALLQEYLEMAQRDVAQAAAEPRPGRAASRPPEAEATARASAQPPAPEPEAEAPDETLPVFEPPAVEATGELDLSQPFPERTDVSVRAATERGPLTFETIDEDTLSHEVLPRTATFEEELVIMLAFHRKAIRPKDVAGRFRRLDYATKLPATEDNVKSQVDTDHRFFELVADGRIALTSEGRAEAQRLLERLLAS